MEIILILALILLGYGIGTLHSTYKFIKLMKSAAKEAGIDLDAELKEHIKNDLDIQKLQVVKHDDVLYLYNIMTNDFICQGKTLEELATLAKEYKKIEHAVVAHEEKMFVFHEGKPVEMAKL